MIVTVTSLKLRSLFGFFRLSWNGLQISRQAKSQPGFLRMKNTGAGYLHFTLTAWKDEAALKAFSRSGAHLAAMKQAKTLAQEVRVHTYTSEQFPTWTEAKRLLSEKGRAISY